MVPTFNDNKTSQYYFEGTTIINKLCNDEYAMMENRVMVSKNIMNLS